ncbi:MAG: penicillin-binding transpeptidase domain-containing protein, partial [Patescibacteria group bacterium]
MAAKIGIAFPDYIHFEKPRKIRNLDFSEKSGGHERALLLLLIFAFATGLIFLRLLSLQVFKGSYFRELSDNNRTKTILIHAERGTIFDRSNKPLVYNVPGFRKIEGKKTRILETEAANELLAKGENLEIDSLREYPYKDAFAHVLGFLGQISEEELKTEGFKDYSLTDLVGKEGIERQYEGILKGVSGKRLIEEDSKGKEIRVLGETEPIAGRDITLTLDRDLQLASFRALEKVKRGAVVVTSPKGEILALLSKPFFDPNLFTLGEFYKPATSSGYQNVEEILGDSKNQPLLNRSISGAYPPGSTFKIVTASSGLEDGIIDESYTVEDVGILRVGAFSFANWLYTGYGRTDGTLNVVSGIKRSNDIFFYKLAEKVGVERLSSTAEKFGLGKPLGIDLAGEAKGLVPTPSWKEEAVGESWYLGDTYHYGIGQGFVLTTPLQVNAWTQAVANEGTIYRPFILKNLKPKTLKKNLLSGQNTSLIRQGMVESCSPGGVAWPLFDFKVKNKNLEIDGKNFLEVLEATISG